MAVINVKKRVIHTPTISIALKLMWKMMISKQNEMAMPK